jgi:hypothetical protein
MSINRLLTVAGFLLFFTVLSHANNLSQILSSHAANSNSTLVCEQTDHPKFGGVSK